MRQVKQATDDDLARFYDGLRLDEWQGYALKKGRLVQAFGLILRGKDGHLYGALDIPAGLRSPMTYRYAKRTLAGLSEPVRVKCDEGIPRAKEFLERLGFVPDDHKEYMIWRP